MSEMLAEIKSLIEDQGTAWHDKFKTIEANLRELEKRSNRPGAAAESVPAKAADSWYDTKTRQPVRVLDHGQPLADERKGGSVGRMLRGLVMAGRADDAAELADERKALGVSADVDGGYTVAGTLASEWIDLLRARMVLSQAGARTVPMDGATLSLAKLTADPTVSWHGENVPISEAAATFGQVQLQAKTAVCLVKLSLELSQDSTNIETILQSSLVNAMASAMDSAGINGVSTNAAAAPAGLVNLSGRGTVTSVGTPTSWDFALDAIYALMAANVPLESIGAMVANPDLWKKMSKLKTGISSDNTTLTMPAEVARLPKLWTTAAPSGKAIFGDFRDLLFGVRQNIQVRVLTEAFLGSNLQIGILAYARCDFAATRPASFCTAEGITGL
jgi:HK97 family phage major capsid protein